MGKSSTVYLIISYGFSIAMFDYRIVIFDQLGSTKKW